MIDRQNGRIVIECDECGDTFEGDSGDFSNDVWPAAKLEGWKARKVDDVWTHQCEGCGRRL